MKTISKVKSVQGSGSFESKFGAEQPDGKKLLFSYDYEFEDGTLLSANHKTVPSPFKIGDTVEYEVTRETEQYGKSGKVSKPQEQSFQSSSAPSGDSLKGIKIGHAITNAVNLSIALGVSSDASDTKQNIIFYSKMILKIGEELNNEPKEAVKIEVLIPNTILTSEADKR